jgi:endonuclease YncB( thermonuclease family)
MRRGAKTLWALLGLLFALTAAYWRLKSPEPLRREAPDQVTPPGLANRSRLCVRVIDGDTIELEGGERVRLIGVNTPESVDPRRPVEYFGREAAAFTRRTVEGRRVRLEYDEETRDPYGRTLAYVYLPDGTLLNAEIIRQGYGFAYTRFPYRRQAEFVNLEREAREQGRGLWAR